MGSIETSKDIQLGLTTNVARGKISFEDISNWIIKYYAGEVTQLILWDFTQADVADMAPPEFREMAREIKKRSKLRAGGRTALVFSKNIGLSLGRAFEALSEMEGVEFQYKTFRTIAEAKNWLGV